MRRLQTESNLVSLPREEANPPLILDVPGGLGHADKNRTLRASSAAFVSVFCLILASPAYNSASPSMRQAQASKPVEQSYKNIQVLQGLPDSQLLTVMHFMRASLGVRCDYCHVAENGKYWMDHKPAKQIARQHMRMTSELNKANFGGKPAVTCNTCHQGRIKPLSIPSVEQGVFANTTREDGERNRLRLCPTLIGHRKVLSGNRGQGRFR